MERKMQNWPNYITEKKKSRLLKVIKFSSVSQAFHSSIGSCMYEMILNDVSLLLRKKLILHLAKDSK